MKNILLITALLLSLSAYGTNGDSTKTVKSQLLDEAKTDAKGNLDLKFKPYIGFGIGNFTFFGDITNNNKGQHLTVSRLAGELRFVHPITDFLDFHFNTIFGKLSANERSITNLTRNLNFESRIRAGGIGVSYNFNHILKPKGTRALEPFVYVGFESFEFLSKTDLYDKFGNKYHYWDDGSIRNIDQSDPDAGNAIKIQRDYVYETDLRELNIDGNGQYQERSFALPIGAGVNLLISDYFRVRIGGTMHFTFTDLVDNVTGESVGERAGTKGKDKFLFTNVTLSYNLQPFKSKEDELEELKNPWEEELFAADTFDTDKDGVVDFQDICAYTPEDCRPVEANGCSEDNDMDGVPDCRDEELDSPGPFVDSKGVTITDEMIEMAFRRYKDSTGEFSEIEVTTKKTIIGESLLASRAGGAYNPEDQKGKEYFIVLDKKEVNVSANELADYLQWKRFKTIHEGDSVYYVLDGLNLDEAVALNDKLEKDGIETKNISTRKVDDDGKVKVVEVSQIDIDDAKTHDTKVPSLTKSDDITYRVQIGAYTKAQSSKKFIGLLDIVEFQGNDKMYRYYSGIFTNIKDASVHKVIMTSEKEFPDAFVVAFKDGKRISLREVTEVDSTYDEKIDEYEKALKGDGKAFVYTVQVAAYKQLPKDLFDLFLTLDDKLHKTAGENGITRYTIGEYDTEEGARKSLENLKSKGINDAFILIKSDGKLIELKDAQDIINSGK